VVLSTRIGGRRRGDGDDGDDGNDVNAAVDGTARPKTADHKQYFETAKTGMYSTSKDPRTIQKRKLPPLQPTWPRESLFDGKNTREK
ncbi:hypothetical protein LTR28_002926, partial [Elasticomyces elasticus]